ncbi:MAG: TolB family protein [Planctomycetaceae bacterium]
MAFSMKGEDGTMQIGLTSLDGRKNIRQLTRSGDLNMKSAFSPDGRYLAFVRGSQPNIRLIVVNVQTGEETLVAHDAASARPVWRTTAAPKD